MKMLSLLSWFLAGIAATALVYFGQRVAEMFTLVFLVSSYIFSLKAIYNVWDKERTWWGVNNSIRFAIIFQSVNFIIASLFSVYITIVLPRLESTNRTFALFLFLSISLASWFIGRAAWVAAEREQRRGIWRELV
jgi:hypothetical protein